MKSFLLLAGVLAVFVVSCLMYRFYWALKYHHRVAALKAEGFPVSLDDWEALYVLPEGVENTADIYLKAFECYREPIEQEKDNLPYLGNYPMPESPAAIPDEILDGMSKFLDKNQPALDVLHQAVHVEHCLWPKERDTLWLSNERYSELKDAVYLLQLECLFLSETGQAEKAFLSQRSLVALAQSIQICPSLLDLLIKRASQTRAQESLNRMLNRIAYSDEQLQWLQGQFKAMQGLDNLHEAYVIDRICTIAFWNQPYREQGENILNSPAPLPKFLNYVSGMIWRDANLSFDHLEGFLDASQLPLEQRPEAFYQIEAEKGQLSPLHVHIKNGINFLAVNNIDMRAIGQLRCAETALAIERYRLKSGQLPQALDELVPEFLEAVPQEPFDGRPLRYVTDDKGYTVYTIGEDGVDNGGLSKAQMAEKTGQEDPEEFDWPLTVRR